MNETAKRRAQYWRDADKLSAEDIRKFMYVELLALSHHVRVDQNEKIGTLWTWRQHWIGGGKLASVIAVAVGLFLAVLKVWG